MQLYLQYSCLPYYMIISTPTKQKSPSALSIKKNNNTSFMSHITHLPNYWLKLLYFSSALAVYLLSPYIIINSSMLCYTISSKRIFICRFQDLDLLLLVTQYSHISSQRSTSFRTGARLLHLSWWHYMWGRVWWRFLIVCILIFPRSHISESFLDRAQRHIVYVVNNFSFVAAAV